MIIYPAIDIKEGKCVRLAKQGKIEEMALFNENAVDMATKFEQLGAKFLHIIDLDGARIGKPQNISVISAMAVKLGIPIQVGGGIRSIEEIEIVLNKGIERVILGTSAVEDPKLVKEALANFGANIAIAVDAKDGKVFLDGWNKESEFSAVEFAKNMEDLGAKTIIYSDISKSGMLFGPNIKAIEKMKQSVNINIIAAGGVKSIEDIKTLKDIGMSGAIIGRALYTGEVKLEDALMIAEGK